MATRQGSSSSAEALSPAVPGPCTDWDRDQESPNGRVIVVGAGPAGLTAAHELLKLGVQPVVLEKRDKVGGISCTENYRGFYFDMGGHRFFTKVPEVNNLWVETLGEKFLVRPRISRIYYNRKFFAYPLKPFNALAGLGIWQSFLVAASYLRWQIFPYPREESLEHWVTNRFGRRLFQIFFKAYTEKVWGIPCSELRAEWAAQRIKDLSLKSAVLSAFIKPRETIKTLIDEFHYPQHGPGMLWDELKGRLEARGAEVHLGCDVIRVNRANNRITSVVVSNGDGLETVEGGALLSSMPLRELIFKLDPPPPAGVIEAASKLKYRDFLTVCLVVNDPDLFPDNWIYVHDPSVLVGRIQNFKNWSPDMVPVPWKSSLGLEYFCNEGDALWNSSDDDLVERAKMELRQIGLARYEDIEDGRVFRVPKAYPVYDADYQEALPVLKGYLSTLENLETAGRNGLHRYNNMDHAMLTGILGARNLAKGEPNDLWSVNADQEYHEEVEMLQTAVSQAFAKLDRVAFGLSVGIAMGLVLFLATLFLVLRGGPVIGPTMGLLDQFFPGYSVTFAGSLAGLGYGCLIGFVGGWTFAFLRNIVMFLTAAYIRRGSEFQVLKKILEYI